MEKPGINIPPEIIKEINNQSMEITVRNRSILYEILARDSGIGTLRITLKYHNASILSSS